MQHAFSSTVYLAVFIVYIHISRGENGTKSSEPQFLSSMVNSSVTVGRDAALTCHISHTDGYKVAWVRVDTQTVLSFNEHVITKNHRIKVSTPEKTEWRLEISDIKRRDAGFYMCQINTDPMQSRLAYLEVLEPPSISAAGEGTSQDQVVAEGEDVILSCRAGGHPTPVVKWRREDGLKIRENDGQYSDIVVGQVISLTRVSRRDSGAYLCIASNGVPPAVSRRIILEVTYAPSVTLDEEMVTVIAGHSVRLGCSVESYPDPVISWSYSNRAITKGGRYKIYREERKGFVDTSLIIEDVSIKDHMSRYKCRGSNSLGSAEKSVTLQVYDDVGSESDQTSHEEDIKIKQEIVFSNNPGSQHQPTLEIFEIEVKNINKEKETNQYSDSVNNFDDYNHKTESQDRREFKKKTRKNFGRKYLSSGAAVFQQTQIGISIILSIVCVFEKI